MDALLEWKHFQDKSVYYGRVKTDREESTWASIARDYDDIAYPEGSKNIILDRLVPLVRGAETGVEIGPGPGTFSLGLSAHFDLLTLVEPSESMINVVKQRIMDKGVKNIEIIQAEWEEAQVEKCDVVMALGCFYVFYSMDEAIAKMVDRARNKVILSHMSDGIRQFDLKVMDRFKLKKPLFFPSLELLKRVLAQMNLSFKVEKFTCSENRKLPLEQWLDRYQRLFSFPKEKEHDLARFLGENMEREGDCFVDDDDRTFALIEIPSPRHFR